MYILYTAAPFVVTMLYVKKFFYTFASETGEVYFVTLFLSNPHTFTKNIFGVE